jgi:hypothetical protein
MTDTRPMTCQQVDERLSDWLEHDLDSVSSAMLERHAATCARCTGLLADLASIRRTAAALPELVPSRDLWPEIEARIQAPVIALDQPRSTRPALDRGTTRRLWWLGAAAAALVGVTAGVTHYMTLKNNPVAPSVVASQPTVVRSPESTVPAPDTQPAAELVSAERPDSPRAPRPASTSAAPGAADQSEYARDVAQLRAIVSERRADLDSTTIAVLEKNLELIDRAIAESRAALERDPASDFLADQLARAMTKKVAILRTVALLPARS